jgi:hypothetical protein
MSDGLYNYLVAELEVNVYTAGNYRMEVYGLGGGDGRLWHYVYNKTYLSPGLQNISIRFIGAVIRQSRINVTKLVDIYLYHDYKYT